MSCAVSMIMDHYIERWQQPHPVPQPWVPVIPAPPMPSRPAITDEEVAEFRRLLERAREHDRKNGNPDCELDEKKQLLKRLATELGIDIAFLDSPRAP
jgi:hypothetical protein